MEPINPPYPRQEIYTVKRGLLKKPAPAYLNKRMGRLQGRLCGRTSSQEGGRNTRGDELEFLVSSAIIKEFDECEIL